MEGEYFKQTFKQMFKLKIENKLGNFVTVWLEKLTRNHYIFHELRKSD